MDSFKYAAPVVSSLGVSLEELAAATGIMADVGIRGEQAGTTLRGGLVQLLKPAEKTAKMMESMGIQVTDANGKFIGLAGVIREFQDAMKGMTDTQKLATLSQIVGTEAASGFLALMKAGPSEIEKMTKALENSGGASKKAAEQMMGGIGGALEELSGAFETLSILIGSQLAPYIQTFATWLSGLIQRFNEASPAVQKFVAIGLALTAGLTGLIAVLGAVAAGIGFMITGIMPLISAIAQAGGVTALLSGALAFLANPITLTIAGITALVAAFAFAYSQFEGFRNVINSVFSTLMTFVQPALTAVTTFIREQITALSEWWRQIWPDLSLAFMNIWNGIVAFITPILNTILAIFKFVWPAVEYIVKSVWENIKGVIEGAIAVITGIIQAFSALFTGDWDALWNAIKQIISGAIEFVWNLFNLLLYGRLLKAGTALLNGLKAVFSAGWNAIKTNTSKVFTSIWNFLKNIWNSTVNFFKNTLNGIRATFMNVFNAVRSFVSNVFSNIRTIISNAIKSIKDFVSSGLDNIRKFFTDTFDKVVSFLKGIDLVSVGKDIISGLVRGLSSMAGAVISAVADVAGKIKDKFLSFFGIHSPSRVMRDEVGKYLPLGLIAGIKRMKNDVISAAEQMAKWATPDVPRMSLAYSTPTGVYGSLSSAVNGTVNVDSRDEILAAAIDRLERSLDGMTIVMDGERVGHLVRGYVNEGNAVDATIRRYFG
ncbi:phage tail tape measure protein [Aeribacillus pallidus]|nr:phage tail tape measure protein [Aeribacillus pallidus]